MLFVKNIGLNFSADLGGSSNYKIEKEKEQKFWTEVDNGFWWIGFRSELDDPKRKLKQSIEMRVGEDFTRRIEREIC